MKNLNRSLFLALALTTSASVAVNAQTFEESAAAHLRKEYGVAFNGFAKLAEQGNAKAQNRIGWMYEHGYGVPKDEQQAAAWYLKAAEQGNATAQTNLGMMYRNGRGVTKDEQQAIVWFRKAAEQGDGVAQVSLGAEWHLKAAAQGNAEAQYNLGVMYFTGQGLPKNDQQAAAWYRKAADQGLASAQYNLGLMYGKGQGVLRDDQTVYFWWLLASSQGHQQAASGRDQIERYLSQEERAAAQAAARNWKPKTAAQSMGAPGRSSTDFGGPSTAPSRPAPVTASPTAQAGSTGSGFRIARGAIVTNHHVIDGCSRLRVNGVNAQVRGSDARSDLALLAVTLAGPSVSLRSQRAAVGETVAVAGFPLRGLLSGFNMTTGSISSMSGLGGDTLLVQITAPVQPGNSGGPMLDSAGNLMGVVVSKLDALKAAKLTGDIPQNVNFAINANVLRSFLDANSVDYESTSSEKPIMPTAIAEKARGFTVLVECWK